MPIYEYRCASCEHEFETIQKLSEAPLTECPSCHEQRLVKKISAAGFRLKGGGWYETDFKGGGKRNVAGDNGSESSTGAAEANSAGSEPKSGGTETKTGGSETKTGGTETKSGGSETKSGGDSGSGSAKTASAD